MSFFLLINKLPIEISEFKGKLLLASAGFRSTDIS